VLFNCHPRTHAAAAKPQSRKTVKVKNKRKNISVDLHCHIHAPAADDIAKQTAGASASPTARYGNPRTEAQQKKLHGELLQKLTSIEQRIKDMDKMDIDVQAISSSPLQYYYGVETDLGRQIARTINERLAEIAASHPERFAPLGTLPMQEPALAVQELEYCMKKIYYDTMVFGEPQLDHLVNLCGADHVVIGTDYPYDMGYYKPVDFVEKAKKLTRTQKDQIIGGTAARLLGLNKK
jgi:predicted TIM-barrel fold metal-dependent hydrolase